MTSRSRRGERRRGGSGAAREIVGGRPTLSPRSGWLQPTPGHGAGGVGSEEHLAGPRHGVRPSRRDVAAGEAVTWNLIGPHTISFNAPESAQVMLAEADDGLFHLSEEALAPAGYEPPPPPEGEPEGPPPTVDGGTFDGTGFLNSGILFDQPFTLVFSTAGTYEYICVIHPEMEGTVTVS